MDDYLKTALGIEIPYERDERLRILYYAESQKTFESFIVIQEWEIKGPIEAPHFKEFAPKKVSIEDARTLLKNLDTQLEAAGLGPTGIEYPTSNRHIEESYTQKCILPKSESLREWARKHNNGLGSTTVFCAARHAVLVKLRVRVPKKKGFFTLTAPTPQVFAMSSPLKSLGPLSTLSPISVEALIEDNVASLVRPLREVTGDTEILTLHDRPQLVDTLLDINSFGGINLSAVPYRSRQELLRLMYFPTGGHFSSRTPQEGALVRFSYTHQTGLSDEERAHTAFRGHRFLISAPMDLSSGAIRFADPSIPVNARVLAKLNNGSMQLGSTLPENEYELIGTLPLHSKYSDAVGLDDTLTVRGYISIANQILGQDVFEEFRWDRERVIDLVSSKHRETTAKEGGEGRGISDMSSLFSHTASFTSPA